MATPIETTTTPARTAAAGPTPPRPSCPVPEELQLEVEASDRVNLDEDGRSRPTRVRVYQLSDLSRVTRASFEELWQQPKQALAATALTSDELTVYPGQALVHRVKRETKADFVAAVAVFREPQADAWRTLQELPLPGDPCQASGMRAPKLDKLRVRVFLEDSHIDSVHNYAGLPLRNCETGAANCAAAEDSNELRRQKRLRSFEEDAREPELAE